MGRKSTETVDRHDQMSRAPVAIGRRPQVTVNESAWCSMTEKRISATCRVVEEGVLIGVISIGDCVKARDRPSSRHEIERPARVHRGLAHILRRQGEFELRIGRRLIVELNACSGRWPQLDIQKRRDGVANGRKCVCSGDRFPVATIPYRIPTASDGDKCPAPGRLIASLGPAAFCQTPCSRFRPLLSPGIQQQDRPVRCRERCISGITPFERDGRAQGRESKCNASSAVSPPKEWAGANRHGSDIQTGPRTGFQVGSGAFQLVQREADVAEPSCLELAGLKLIERLDARQVTAEARPGDSSVTQLRGRWPRVESVIDRCNHVPRLAEIFEQEGVVRERAGQSMREDDNRIEASQDGCIGTTIRCDGRQAHSCELAENAPDRRLA
jgi:hypothetical protein